MCVSVWFFIVDTSDDILAKYRRKTSTGGSETTKVGKTVDPEQTGSTGGGGSDDERLSIEPGRVEASYAFKDAKKKLRLVLSTADIQQVPDKLPTVVSQFHLLVTTGLLNDPVYLVRVYLINFVHICFVSMLETQL